MLPGPVHPLLTRDPASGAELLVTRLEAPASGIVIEGNFTMGWVARLTPEQLEFVGMLLRNRNNLQKVANDLGVAYNTARSRLDEVVAAVGGALDDDDDDTGSPPRAGSSPKERAERRQRALDRLAAGEASVDDVLAELRARD